MPDHIALPDGRRLSLDASTIGKVLGGVVWAEGIAVGERPAVWDAVAAVAAEHQRRYDGLKPSEVGPLAEARRLYRAFGMDPSRRRPSSEALLRRVLAGKDLYRINNAVDACNLASLTFLLPIGMYDVDRLDGDLVMRVGREGEEYAGIRKGPVHLADRLALFDRSGGFGSPTSDSARTAVAPSTTTLLAVIMASDDYDREQMRCHAALFGDLMLEHCDARSVAHDLLGG